MATMRKAIVSGVLAAALISGGAGSAGASEIVFNFINPSFGGNPFNSAHLLGIANAINKHEDPRSRDRAGFGTQTDSDLFVRQLQSRLLSDLAIRVSEAIFGENPAQSGRVQFGNQIITFERGLENIRLVIFDTATGTTTEVLVPQLQVQ